MLELLDFITKTTLIYHQFDGISMPAVGKTNVCTRIGHTHYNNNNNRFLYSDFPGLQLVQTALHYTLLQLNLFIITDNYRAPPRYMTDTYNVAFI